MTEAEWLACTDPVAMLEFLRARGMVSNRKLRLLACACCRRVWHLLGDKHSRKALRISEAYADGQVAEKELRAARYAALQAACKGSGTRSQAGLRGQAREVLRTATEDNQWLWGGMLCAVIAMIGVMEVANDGEPCNPSVLFRDLIGSPCRLTPLDPLWLNWNDGTIRKLVESIYDEQAFDRPPILADALEEAGCADAALLDHCRGPGPHVRGCWVVDLLLAKE